MIQSALQKMESSQGPCSQCGNEWDLVLQLPQDDAQSWSAVQCWNESTQAIVMLWIRKIKHFNELQILFFLKIFPKNFRISILGKVLKSLDFVLLWNEIKCWGASNFYGNSKINMALNMHSIFCTILKQTLGYNCRCAGILTRLIPSTFPVSHMMTM